MMRQSLRPLMLAMLVCATTLLTGRAGAETASPCALLPASAVEAVLNAPLATAPFRANGTDPAVDGGDCRYETATFRAITVHVDWTDGGLTFGMMNNIAGQTDAAGLKGVVQLSDGSTVRGSWDEARIFMCCQFLSLRGEQLVTIDVAGSDATLADAAALADLAVQGLDAPAPVDDAAAVAAAVPVEAARPAIVSVCDLLAGSEVEAILGAAPNRIAEGDEETCTFDWTMADGSFDASLTLKVIWRGGFSELRSTLSALGVALDVIDPAGNLASSDPTANTAGLDALATTFIGVSGVRKDVLLSVETGGMNNDIATALIRAVAAKF